MQNTGEGTKFALTESLKYDNITVGSVKGYNIRWVKHTTLYDPLQLLDWSPITVSGRISYLSFFEQHADSAGDSKHYFLCCLEVL